MLGRGKSTRRQKSWYACSSERTNPQTHRVILTDQRRVKFPFELDVLDLVTDELKQKLLPVNTKLKQFERDRAERRKIRKRTKQPRADLAEATGVRVAANADGQNSSAGPPDVQMADAAADPDVPSIVEDNSTPAGGALEEESVYREREKQELEALVSDDLKRDVGCSVTGLYELVGTSCLSLVYRLSFGILTWPFFGRFNRYRHAQRRRRRLGSLYRLRKEIGVPSRFPVI